MPSLEQLGHEKYILLTTFRRDGRAVATPIWVVPDGDGVACWTTRDSGKVKRIRNGARVTLAACDVRGRTSGETLEASATIGSTQDLRRVTGALASKYGILGRLTLISSRIRRGADGTVAILVR